MNIIVVSGTNGTGRFTFPDSKDLNGASVFINNLEFVVGPGNKVNIPAKVMREWGYLRSDGKHAICIVPSYTHVDGKLLRGGSIVTKPGVVEYLEKGKTGQTIPNKFFDNFYDEYLEPLDIEEDWYPYAD